MSLPASIFAAVLVITTVLVVALLIGANRV
jgi:hypothetical protein